jgi:glycosyltransferase involved in cell wall biosynthesis
MDATASAALERHPAAANAARAPLVTVGMPAYNSRATIAAAIASIQAQTLTNFELLVADNASTDDTARIVAEIARADPRIRLIAHPRNIGANGNYSSLVAPARGEFFKWASSNDHCAPRFLEACVSALRERSDAVLAAPRTMLWSGNIASAQPYEHDVEVLDDRPVDRLRTLTRSLRLNNPMNGVIRTATLRSTRLIRRFQSADVVLMGELALRGKILRVDEPLYFRRMEPSTSTSMQDDEARRRHHYPRPTLRMQFQAVQRHLAWLDVGLRTPAPLRERAAVLDLLVRQCYWERADFAADLALAARSARHVLGGRRA